ncbi:SBBP repeat-containing protein [Emticicia sp. C21]|uniref:SBBP repeat-containing protein n=1 Tax=Emticicia sp. C21 TaxID=2302915 RepID=UPI000E342FCE|nr:SBBP repeat-containing protein [Emticicia sp. C21]RFS17790.1 hypothetical protein D0T08_00640 [Emticicia sp. C21]
MRPEFLFLSTQLPSMAKGKSDSACIRKLLCLCFASILFTQVNGQNVTITPNGITPAMAGGYQRLSYEAMLAIQSPQKGDLVYDTTYDCLRVFDGKWKRTNPENEPGKTVPIMAAGEAGEDYIRGIAADKNFTYMIGGFENSINFGPVQLLSRGGTDIYIAKYDRNGEVQWAQGIGGPNSEGSSNIAIDNQGNIYVCGTSSGSMYFSMLQSLPDLGLFLAKYNKDGVLLWAKMLAKNPYNISPKIKLDNAGNVFIAGTFYGDLDFGNTKLTSRGNEDIFIAKHTNDGNFLWANSGGGPGNERLYGFTVDNNGAYLTGFGYGIVTFGAIVKNLTKSSSSDLNGITVKFNPTNGEWRWVQGLNEDPNTDTSIYLCGVGTDTSGNVYSVGTFTGTIKVGLFTYTSQNFYRILTILKYDSTGYLQNFYYVNSKVYPSAATVDNDGNIYIIGSRSPDGVLGDKTFIAYDNFSKTFIAKYNKNSNLQWVTEIRGQGYNTGSVIALDPNNGIHVGGIYQDGSIKIDNLSRASKGFFDIFAVRIDP